MTECRCCSAAANRTWIRPIALVFVAWGVFATSAAGAEPVDFDRDIRPILADACFRCHGPDDEQRQAGLRLDTRDGVFARDEGTAPVVPHQADKSELIRRITATNADERMPPADAARQLTAAEIDLLRRWVASGAEWQEHWAFTPIVRPAVPAAGLASEWVRNPIDAFVLERLGREGLKPSPEATREELIRRVTLDLTGLPPTPDEVSAFLDNRSPDAYERLVDRLLASPRFGERMAVPWLDAARYADTNGYQSDGERSMWRWRDWVIDAYNANMPFDQFTVEQLAGDLLPGTTLDQRIATAFNRNHRGNAEGGIIPEEYLVEYVVDRVETTGTVFLGLTVGCARCHDHKFDPVSQREFYQLFAYFHNVPEHGRAVKFGNSPPFIAAPTPEQQRTLAELDRRVQAAEQRLADHQTLIEATQSAWENSPAAAQPRDWTLAPKLEARFEFEQSDAPAVAERPNDRNLGRGDTEPEVRFVDGDTAFVDGPRGRAPLFDGKRFAAAAGVGRFSYLDRFSCGAWIFPNSDSGGTIVSCMVDEERDRAKGWQFRLRNGKLEANFVVRWLDDSLRVRTAAALEPNRWQHVMVTYDGSRTAAGVQILLNGRRQELVVDLDALNQEFRSEEPLRIGAGGGPEARFHGAIDDVRLYAEALSSDQVEIIATPERIDEIAARPRERRSAGQSAKLREFFLQEAAPPQLRAAHRERLVSREAQLRFTDTLPTVMVMEEMETPRTTFVLNRGQYDQPGEAVESGVPAVLPAMPSVLPKNRLGLARWIVSSEHPLTARVAVNRYWQMVWGTGLVETAEDFGTQGSRPSHRELLDWLAAEFRDTWDTKALLRTIVTSATYRQSSRGTRALIERDPGNRLLSRGPRFRLSAEMIRDQALAASGLLVERVGGPSVMPYQPDGLWKELATITEYPQSHGPGLYRRSLYTFWKRTVAPPTMATFDATARETCIVRRSRTNTPLQALALLNDVTYLEAARVLAEQTMRDIPAGESARIRHVFRRLAGRTPSTAELDVLVAGYRVYLEQFSRDPAAAGRLLSVGETRRDPSLPAAETAALATVASLILNLDEVVSKE